MAFLHDAQRLELLRAIGSVYQFRHAAFQDHLVAAQEARAREVVASLAGSAPRRGSGVFMASALASAFVVSLVGLLFTTTTAAERVQSAVVVVLTLRNLLRDLGPVGCSACTARQAAERVQSAVVAGLALLGLIWIAVRRHRRGEALIPSTWLAALRRRSSELPPR